MVFQATPEDYFRKFAPKNFTQAPQPAPQQFNPYADAAPQAAPSVDPNLMIFCITALGIVAIVALILYRGKR